jgi:hypothetical protein
MVPGRTGRFVPVPQDVAVAVAVVSGSMDDDVALPRPEDPLKPDDAIRG